MALDLHMWVEAYVRGPKHAYVGTFLHMQLGFQKYKKDKFSTIMAKVWNKFHIILELFQTPFFPLYKALHGTFSKYTKILWEKPKIH